MPKGQRNPDKPAKPRKNKAKRAASPEKGHNSDGALELSEAQRQDLFLSHKNALITVKGKLATAVANVRNIKKKIKADGYTVRQVEAAILMETEEGEAKVRAETADILQAARWVGVAWGETLDMFNQPDRVPATDKAFDQGKRDSMENKPRKAQHAPESPQAASYYAGYDKHQGELHKGFKTSKPKGENVSDFPQPSGEAAE